MTDEFESISVIDSHTGGEPTRIIVDGGPDLGAGTIADRAKVLEQKFAGIRNAVIGEPRGSDVMVGGILCEPLDSKCSAAVVFFDGAGLLGMCGHGMIGFAVSVHHLGKMGLGDHLIETPVGVVNVKLLNRNTVRIRNVPSYRLRKGVEFDVPGYGNVSGDIGWGGNWFFLTGAEDHVLDVGNSDSLLSYAKAIRSELIRRNITGSNGGAIEHIELIGAARNTDCNARSFVLCPGGQYDRSPCGTGTSAKIACLAADGLLQPGEVWRQESVVGSVFEGSFEWDGEKVIPTIKGSAYVSGETKLLMDANDPFRYGIPS